MRLSIIIILFSISVTTLLAQEINLKGKVVDSSNNEPIYLTNIYIEGTSVGTATNMEGEFELTYEFTANDVIVVSHLIYENQRIELSLFEESEINLIKLDRKILSSQSVLVKGSIGKEGETPITFSQITREEIEDNYINQDLPEFLSYLPSTTFYSESGNGLGYNYISIRGFDQRRISISVNGIPQNDPEDHNVYWLDIPDLLESAEMVQVQRGAGSGVIGYPAVGGSINIITSSFSNEPKFELASTLGSYNTRKYSASFSSGLLNSKYSIYAKLSKTLSSGYRDNSWIDFNSFHVSAVRYDENVTSQINIFGGPVADGLAYYGIPKELIKDRELRKMNYLGADDIENFSQPHYELLNEIKLSDDITINSALFLILGDGFFDYDGTWGNYSYFRLTPENGFDISGDPDTLFMSKAVIRAMVENEQWGWIPRVSIKNKLGELILGGELRIHNSVHWGSLNYAEGLPQGVAANFRYYYYEGSKDIINVFANHTFNISENINALVELQFAYHKYGIQNERYLGNNFTIEDFYFNPRVGLNYKFNSELNVYAAFARVTREPRLKNYYDAAESSGGAVPQFQLDVNDNYDFDSPLVQPETMNNIEVGTSYNKNGLSLGMNLFYMIFQNEIVKKGQVDRFGQPITGNMDETIHSGIEFTGGMKIKENLDLQFNVSYSKNYISEGRQYLDEQNYIDLKNNRISGFPDVTLNAVLKFKKSGFMAQLSAKYVGDYYSDNYDENLNRYLTDNPGFVWYDDNKVDAYFVMNAFTSYELNLEPYLKKVKIFCQINNIFDNLYAAYAIGGEYFPAAERNFLVGVKLGF
ncbi:TonB-dependent receptor [Bacteroidota bacterium]